MGDTGEMASGGLIVRTLLLTAMLGGSINGIASAAEEASSPPRPDVTTALAAANPWPPPRSSVSWSRPDAAARRTVHLQLLGFNDFHGNLQSPSVSSARPVGGAAALAGYLEALQHAAPGRTLIVQAGDQLGASPPITSLLQNEPAIEFLNLMANQHCRYASATRFFDAQHWQSAPNRCNVVGTLGNHEFDAGPAEIQRLLGGGNAPGGPFIEHPYRGSRVPYVCANVTDRRTGKLLLPAYAVVVVGGIPVGVIGAVLRDTPSIVPAWAVANLEFLDEAQSINRAAAELTRRGIHTLIVLIHQGLEPVPTTGDYDWRGPLRDIVAQLDPDIDVVVSGHTHNYTNALLPSRGGTPVLITQAYAYGVAVAQIDLHIDPVTRHVVSKSARIVPTWADVSPGKPGDPGARRLTEAAQKLVVARVGRVVGQLQQPMTRALSAAGESTLGDLVADAQRAATHADIALMNPGGLRSDLRSGPVTWGDVLTLHPFANHLITLDMTGAQLLSVLEEQWPLASNALPRILKTSGLYYSWDPARPAGARIVEACDLAHEPVDPARHYRVAVNDFLANGGDGFAMLKGLGPGESGPLDSEALEQYLESHSKGTAVAAPRIARADLGETHLCAAH
jgi:5'-nucleotidase